MTYSLVWRKPGESVQWEEYPSLDSALAEVNGLTALYPGVAYVLIEPTGKRVRDTSDARLSQAIKDRASR